MNSVGRPFLTPLRRNNFWRRAGMPPPLSAAPRSIIGRRIRVHWPDDDEWWVGVVENYTSRRGWKVSYDKVDGEDDLPPTWHDLDAVQHEIVPAAKREALFVPTAQRVSVPPADPARQTPAKPPASSAPGSTPRPAPVPTPKLPPKPSPCKVAGHQFDSSDESDAGEST